MLSFPLLHHAISDYNEDGHQFACPIDGMKSLTGLLIVLLTDKCISFAPAKPMGGRSDAFILRMSLKPAAVPLMDSGKALARSGELLIDLTTDLDIYGGGLSTAGAQIRNAGDAIAQAAASCRFKTGNELIIDELRQSATCLDEACAKFKLAVQEARADGLGTMAGILESTINPLQACTSALEAAGASIMRNEPPPNFGAKLVETGQGLKQLSSLIETIDAEKSNARLSSQRMSYAADQMILAGNELLGVIPEKPKGKSWLKS